MLRRVTSATFAASLCMMVTIPIALARSAAVRCDGRWHSIPNGLHGAANTPLSSVSGISKDDVWAVGRHGLANGRSRALILHWNGSSWASAAPPDVSYSEWLFAVDAVATDDVWAVGWAAERRHNHALIEHWDGSAWTQS